ncbi:DegT/DnrJ/EryC1/StrS family aminotransferase [Puniceicoccaceae bacterium K14]|nr:DegT/DnrJ/EryC1/StrS family aminotransferase [Puniceicoccaceae bacterium K14]
MKVPYIDLNRSHQELKSELLDAFSKTIDHGGYCLGPDVKAFEEGFASLSGFDRVVAVGSGTEALHLAGLALGIGPGDEVITPAFTFIASAWLAQYTGAKIVFSDVDSTTYTLDPNCIEKLITDKTKAIVVTHLYGQAADMDPIMDIAQKHDLKVVEDAAQAHLAQYKGRAVGTIGDAGIFSFYPTKNLGALGEGGCVVSKHAEVLDRVAVLRAHGSEVRYLNHHVGYNNRMEGLQAASLNVKLPALPEKTERRQAIAERYLARITNPAVILPQPVEWGKCVNHVFTVLHEKRDEFKDYLTSKGVGVDIVYPVPLHLQPCFAYLGYNEGDFPVSEKSAARCLSLPIFPELTDDEVDYVIECINNY